MKTAGDHTPVGLDENPAWDYVAQFLYPGSRNAREVLAMSLINGLSCNATTRQQLAVHAAARALMGTTWVEIFVRGKP